MNAQERITQMTQDVFGKLKIRVYDEMFYIEMDDEDMETFLIAKPWPTKYKCNLNNVRAMMREVKFNFPKARFVPYKEKLLIKKLLKSLEHLKKSYSLEDPIIEEAITKADVYLTK